jgi:hypothetical protein
MRANILFALGLVLLFAAGCTSPQGSEYYTCADGTQVIYVGIGL